MRRQSAYEIAYVLLGAGVPFSLGPYASAKYGAPITRTRDLPADLDQLSDDYAACRILLGERSGLAALPTQLDLGAAAESYVTVTRSATGTSVTVGHLARLGLAVDGIRLAPWAVHLCPSREYVEDCTRDLWCDLERQPTLEVAA